MKIRSCFVSNSSSSSFIIFCPNKQELLANSSDFKKYFFKDDICDYDIVNVLRILQNEDKLSEENVEDFDSYSFGYMIGHDYVKHYLMDHTLREFIDNHFYFSLADIEYPDYEQDLASYLKVPVVRISEH